MATRDPPGLSPVVVGRTVGEGLLCACRRRLDWADILQKEWGKTNRRVKRYGLLNTVSPDTR